MDISRSGGRIGGCGILGHMGGETMRIYVDMDDVLCETAAHLCKLAACEFGRHVAYANRKSVV